MSAEVEEHPAPVTEIPLFYTADSLRFARNLLSGLEHEIKEKAKQLTRDAGRGVRQRIPAFP